MTYTTTKVQFDKLVKKLNRLFKKLDEINAIYTFNVIREFADDVPVYAIDELAQTKHKIDTIKVECVEFELEFNPYKVGNYRVGCVLERTLSDENLIYTLDETVDFSEYKTATLRCDHCGTNHNRKKVVVLIDNETGEHKMVGKACLKDFIGISVESFAAYLYTINEILDEADMEIHDTDMHLYERVIDVVEFLAAAIRLTEQKGYYKGMAFDAFKEMKNNTAEYIAKANEMIKFFEGYDTESEDRMFDPFEHNTKMYLTGKTYFATPNGIVAYAPTLYKRIIERLEKEAQRKANAEKSNYVGEVGDKITITVKFDIVTGYESQYGYVRIYKFVDANGNVYIWKTSNYIDTEKETITVRGTITNHNAYKGEKQTVLTRCKVVA